MDRGGEGGPRDAQEDVHPPRQPDHRGAVDAESCLVPQAETDEQHIRQARTGEYNHRWQISVCLPFYGPGVIFYRPKVRIIKKARSKCQVR